MLLFYFIFAFFSIKLKVYKFQFKDKENLMLKLVFNRYLYGDFNKDYIQINDYDLIEIIL